MKYIFYFNGGYFIPEEIELPITDKYDLSDSIKKLKPIKIRRINDN